MTKQETKEAIKVMQAYADGKTIEFMNNNGKWCDVCDPGWHWFTTKYRIKPELHYRPFRTAEEVTEAIKEHGDWVIRLYSMDWKHRIISFSSGRVITGYNYDDDGDGEGLDEAFKRYTFADGTPFGVKEE